MTPVNNWKATQLLLLYMNWLERMLSRLLKNTLSKAGTDFELALGMFRNLFVCCGSIPFCWVEKVVSPHQLIWTCDKILTQFSTSACSLCSLGNWLYIDNVSLTLRVLKANFQPVLMLLCYFSNRAHCSFMFSCRIMGERSTLRTFPHPVLQRLGMNYERLELTLLCLCVVFYIGLPLLSN